MVCPRAVALLHRFRDRTKEITHFPKIYGVWLGFKLAETTLVQDLQGGGQAQQEPNSVKYPAVEAEWEENPVQGKWQEAQCAGNEDSK